MSYRVVMTMRQSPSAARIFIKIFAAAFVLCWFSAAFGQQPQARHAELDSAGKLIFRMRLDEADTVIGGFIARNPENPAGYFFHATALGYRLFFTPESDNTRELEQAIERANGSCRDRAEKYCRSSETRLEGTVYLAMSHGLEALLALLEGRYLVMAPLGLKAWKLLREAVEIDPTFYDCYFGLGLCRYFTATLPRVVKIMAQAYGFQGDREQGLTDLRLAMKRGFFAGDAARMMYVNIFCSTERPDTTTLSLARDLYQRFPDNPLVHFRYGDILLRLKRYNKAEGIYREVARRIEKNDPPFYRNRIFTRYSFDFRLGVCARRTGRNTKALEHFSRVLAGGNKVKPGYVVPMSHMHTAEILLSNRERHTAKEHLERVLKYDEVKGSHKRARALLKQIGK
ncbi:MAG: tetratricopeptide repeat protein [Gemmatimonadota bacterium]|nr:tetratricopeptide repeat protein [Gemmatimonadota bacterium]